MNMDRTGEEINEKRLFASVCFFFVLREEHGFVGGEDSD